MKLSLEKTFHLFSRAGFGCSFQEAEDFRSKSDIANWVNSQRAGAISIKAQNELTVSDMKKMSKEERKELRKASRLLGIQLNVKWVKQMVNTQSVLQEKMTLFWHGHFACSVFNPHHLAQLNNVMRTHALGNFRTLLMEVSKSPAMINYLHLKQNKKQSPNEDFARELCELFTLGRDNVYTEKDIPEIARAFTGWMTDKNGKFVFNTKRHDFGKKTIFGKTGNFKGEDVIDLLLEKKETASFIAAKVYRYFVNPKINPVRVGELADVFYNSNYDIGKLMTYLFSSKWFYARENMGSKIKSPIELMVGLMRTFYINLEKSNGYVFIQKVLEQVLFKPPNVAGWPGDKKWIDSSRLAFRLRLPAVLLTNGVIDLDEPVDLEASPKELKKRGMTRRLGATADLERFLRDNKRNDYTAILLRGTLSTAAQELLSSSRVESEKERVLRILSLPEYQMC